MDPYLGVKKIGKDMNMVTVWSGLHNRAQSPYIADGKYENTSESRLIDGTDIYALQQLDKALSSDWSGLCAAVGWTVYGAVALSWCRNAKANDVFDGWLSSGYPLRPIWPFERPARLLNPAFLPQTPRISKIHQWAVAQNPPSIDVYQLSVCACLAALKDAPEFDLEPAELKTAAPQLAAFLKSRILRKAERTKDENALIEVWSQVVKGTQWDVWKSEIA